jgi:hypothetical protein
MPGVLGLLGICRGRTLALVVRLVLLLLLFHRLGLSKLDQAPFHIALLHIPRLSPVIITA